MIVHRRQSGSEDGTTVRAGEGTGGTGHQSDPSRNAPSVFGRGEDPHCAVRLAWRGQHRRAVPPRRDRAEPVLPLVEGISGSRQEAFGWRYGAGSNPAGGQGSAPGGRRAEGGGCRAGAGKPSAQKKHDRGWGGRGMRYPAGEKLEIIRLVEQAHLPVRRTLEKLGIPRATFYRWYDLYQSGGPEALEDRSSRPSRVWNRIPDEIRRQIITLALEQPDLSPRELAVRFTD